MIKETIYKVREALARDIKVIRFVLPDREALAEILDGFTELQGLELDPERRGSILDALQGLTWNEAEDALAFALVTDKKLEVATAKLAGYEVTESQAADGKIRLTVRA
jgi:hypothetical protein